MNYNKMYHSIISVARNRILPTGIYTENHHIIPKSIGGSNIKSNKVRLLPREHYIVHWLLTKFTTGKDRARMMCAMKRFSHSRNYNFLISSRRYAIIRKEHAIAVSILRKGTKVSEKTREKMSVAQKKRFSNQPGTFLGKKHSQKTLARMSEKQSLENNPQFGKPRSKDVRDKISKSMLGVPKSPDTIKKFKKRKIPQNVRDKITEGLKRYHEKRKMGPAIP